MTNCTLRDATLGSPRAEKTVANDMDALAPGVRTAGFLGTTFEFKRCPNNGQKLAGKQSFIRYKNVDDTEPKLYVINENSSIKYQNTQRIFILGSHSYLGFNKLIIRLSCWWLNLCLQICIHWVFKMRLTIYCY